MKTFEYKIVRDYTAPKEENLNELGKYGWELVAVEDGRVFYLKREIGRV